MIAKLRRFLRITAADIVHYSGLLSLRRLVRQKIMRADEVCVLGLHRVLTETDRSKSNSLDGMILTDRTFAKLLAYLQQHFHVIAVETFLAEQTGAKSKARPKCLLTFDDGWKDTHSTAYPWLKKFGMPAAVFLTTGTVGNPRGLWVEQLQILWNNLPLRDQLKSTLNKIRFDQVDDVKFEQIVEWLKHMPAEERQRNLNRLLPESQDCEQPQDSMLTWDEVIQMSRDVFEVGAHTVTHPLLSYEHDTTVEHELRQSKEAIEQVLGKKVRAFAYPNGDWDERVCEWVKKAGYECAFTTDRGWYRCGQNPYLIRRIVLHEGNVTGHDGQFSPAVFNLTLTGWL